MKIFETPERDQLPEGSHDTLDFYQNAYGFVPNIISIMAHSPAVVDSYRHLSGALDKTSFVPKERELIPLIVSVANGCHYCVPIHSMKSKMTGVDQDVIDKIRAGQVLSDPRLEALRQFVLAVTEQRGHVPDAAVDAFLAAGFTKVQVLEVVLGVTLKTLSNYVSHLVDQDLDEPFKTFA